MQATIEQFSQKIKLLQTGQDKLKGEISRLERENEDANNLIKDLERSKCEIEASYQHLLQAKEREKEQFGIAYSKIQAETKQVI